MSNMHNPAHLGEVLREWLPEEMTVTKVANELQISRFILSKLLSGIASVMAYVVLSFSKGICGKQSSDLDPISEH